MAPILLPPLLFPAPDSRSRQWMARLKREKKIRAAGPRLYTSVPIGHQAEAVRRGWAQIVSNLFPNALLTHRTALEYKPSPKGVVYLTGSARRRLRYPGLTLKFMSGPKPLKDDPPFINARVSSMPRALLENLSITRGGNEERTLPREDLERRLEEILRAKGVKELNDLRDRARVIARQFGWKREFKRLDQIVGAMLRSRPAGILRSNIARARSKHIPYDEHCLERCHILFADLRHQPFRSLSDEYSAPEHFRNKAFFEAYFSNYIEGTTFEIEEAEEIVFEGKIPKNRPKDAHDILGTFQIVSDSDEMHRRPDSYKSFERVLKERHTTLMKDRPEAMPGVFKNRPNRAGSTVFVDPGYVIGTLEQGLRLYRDLPGGMARAIFMMFLIADVHPFRDGNGRIARIFMNAELSGMGLSTIIIPTVYREDYMGTLRAMTRRNRPDPLIRMLVKAQEFSHLRFSPYPKILQKIRRRNWFQEPSEARIIIA